MARPLYVIVDWDINFETYESKRLVQACSWVAMPNKHDGKSYRRLIREKDAASIYGAWALIVQIASKCPVRGVLADLDGPLDALDLEDKTGLPEKTFARALEFALAERIGWVRKVDAAEEIHTILSAVRLAAQPRSRKRPQTPEESDPRPQTPADSAKSPQTPADLEQSPQLPQTPAGSRTSAGDSAPRGRARADQTSPDSTEPHRTSAEGVRDALVETTDLLISIFGKKRTRLSQTAELALAHYSDDLPLKPGQAAMLKWFYGLKPDPQDFALCRRVSSADALAENLFRELEKAEAYAAKTGSADANTEKQRRPEPPDWRQNFAKKFPRAAIPATYGELDERVQRELEAVPA